MYSINRENYAKMYGPTTGDKVRLGSFDLLLEIERDYTIYGDETVYGTYGNVSDICLAGNFNSHHQDIADTVITNVVCMDYSKIVKADIGFKNGRIIGIGKSGNPNLQDAVDIIISSNTRIINGAGKILTPGAIDMTFDPTPKSSFSENGITSLIINANGSSISSTGELKNNNDIGITNTLKYWKEVPQHISVLGSCGGKEQAAELLRKGAAGLSIYLDDKPENINSILEVADDYGIQVCIQTNSLNSSAFYEELSQFFKGRTLNLIDPGGYTGGWKSNMALINDPKVIPSSLCISRIVGFMDKDTAVDMLKAINNFGSMPFAISKEMIEEFYSPEIYKAEDVLLYFGKIPIISTGGFQNLNSENSSSLQNIVWKFAHNLKRSFGYLPEDSNGTDNFLAKRFISKYTINPAITYGLDKNTGALEKGLLADCVLWSFDKFADKPDLVFIQGEIVYSKPNPYKIDNNSRKFLEGLRFTSEIFLQTGGDRYHPDTQFEAVKPTRTLSRLDMKYNEHTPKLEIDPETDQVRDDGLLLTHELYNYPLHSNPGEIIAKEGNIEINKGRPQIDIRVTNQGNKPIIIGSHFHFYRVNRALVFERDKTFNMRLNIAAGTVVEFQPGDSKMVRLTQFGGEQKPLPSTRICR